MTVTTVLGETENKDFQLTSNGANLDGTGYAVGMLVKSGVPSLTVDWLNQTNGTVRVSGLAAWGAGTYQFRFTLTDGSGKVCYAPSGAKSATWIVAKALQG